MRNQPHIPGDTLRNVRAILREIEDCAANADYLYRGEPEHYNESPFFGKISSNLYRQYAGIETEAFDIEFVQEEILAEAAPYHHETDDAVEILTRLQHHGGKTNLIDFTTDFLVALFFACDGSGSSGKDGRVILLRKTEELQDMMHRPRNPRHRVIAQKSVFVQHPQGFLSVGDVTIITIPAALKQPVLTYLRKYHGLSMETIYNALHGFIRNQSIHESAYTAFHRGLTYQLKGEESDAPAEKQAAYEKAVASYTQALKMKPDLPEAYNNRGCAYLDMDDIDSAIQDYNTVIEWDSEDAVPYHNRGNAYFDEGDVDKALQDYDTAIKLAPDFALAYYNRGNAYLVTNEMDKAIADFRKAIELDESLELPEDIAALLAPQ